MITTGSMLIFSLLQRHLLQRHLLLLTTLNVQSRSRPHLLI